MKYNLKINQSDKANWASNPWRFGPLGPFVTDNFTRFDTLTEALEIFLFSVWKK